MRTNTEERPAARPEVSATARVRVDIVDGRARLRSHASTSLRPMLLTQSDASVTVALMPVSATLLAGDDVAVEVTVGSGAALRLVEPTGTVAYDMRGGRATWALRADVAPGARLVWWAEPFVVATGADVRRTTSLTVAADACALWRETLVLGRAGEAGGVLHTRTDATDADGGPLVMEEQTYSPLTQVPGLLGPHRVIDTALALGDPPVDLDRVWPDALPASCRFTIAAGGRMGRWLGSDLHDSPYAG